MGLDKNGYWSPREILGYNCKFMIILSERGRGKTVSLKKLMVNQEGEFMALYRDSADMAFGMSTWLDDLVRYNGNTYEEFEWEGSDKEGFKLYHKGKLKGFFNYLSGVDHIKKMSFPDTLNYIWLDEFIPIAWKKLKGVESEGNALRTIMKTIDHDTVHPRETRGYKKLRCFLVGNPHTWNNPMLNYFHCVPQGYGIHRVGPDIVMEHIAPYEKEGPHTLTVDEFLGLEVHKADGWTEQLDFIKDPPRGSKPIYSIRIERNYYAIYQDTNYNIYVCKTDSHVAIKGKQFGSLAGKKVGERPLEKSRLLEGLERDILEGNIYYSDINVKFALCFDLENL